MHGVCRLSSALFEGRVLLKSMEGYLFHDLPACVVQHQGDAFL
jgi:hypothetical protein